MKIDNLIDRDYLTIPASTDFKSILELIRSTSYLKLSNSKRSDISIVTAQDLVNHHDADTLIGVKFIKPKIKIEQSIFEVLKLMIDTNNHFLPVYDKAQFIGIISLLSVSSKIAEISIVNNEKLNGILHDIKNPLLNIRELTKALQSDSKIDQHFLLESITSSITRALGIVESETKDSNELTDIGEFLRKCLADQTGLAISRNIFIKASFCKAKVIRIINQIEVSRAIQNVIHNALKYSTKGTPINVTTKYENNKLIFSVTNVGMDISSAEQEVLFEKKKRVSGLAIANELLIANDAALIYTSNNQVTTFKIIF